MIEMFLYANSTWDQYRDKYSQFIRWRFSKVCGWAPWFDYFSQAFLGDSFFYLDTYAIYNDLTNLTGLLVTHPEYILTDTSGNKLYIPFNCANGACPQFAADISNANFFNYQLGTINQGISKKYRGVYLDDVNLDCKVSDGNGAIISDPLITSKWAEKMVEFVEKIRGVSWIDTPLPKIVHNSIWFSTAPQNLIDRQIQAADYINIERGFGDSNLNNSTFGQLLLYIDHVHSLNRNIIQMEYTKDNLQFKIACFLLNYKKGDLFCCLNLFPDQWDTAVDTDYGEAMSDKFYDNSVKQWCRMYSKCQVLVDFTTKTAQIFHN